MSQMLQFAESVVVCECGVDVVPKLVPETDLHNCLRFSAAVNVGEF
jgi:hypothetical protein